MDKKRLKCTVLSVSGYLLSPLSFWNDLFINFPIAYVFGVLFGLISQKLFLTGLIAGYWLSNIAGFVLLHKRAIPNKMPEISVIVPASFKKTDSQETGNCSKEIWQEHV